MITGTLVPKTATRTAASAIGGNDITTSRVRITDSSPSLREVAAIEPSSAPHDQRHGGRAEADDQRVAGAVHDAGEDVAAGPVGAEPVGAAGCLHRGSGGQRVLGEQWGEYGAEYDDDQYAEGDAGGDRKGAERDARSGQLVGQTAGGEHVTPS